jgi:site-specific DNA-methyltransferase (adenine-specific)
MNVETVPLTSLTPDSQNARKHNKRNLDAIAASLNKFGQRKPIVVTHDGTVIAGNGTLEAATSLGWKEISIARAPEDWDDNTVRAYALADNQTGALAEWDDEILNTALEDLTSEGWDIAELGFDKVEELIVPDFQPIDQVPRLDQKNPSRCPECAFEWHVGSKGEIIPV